MYKLRATYYYYGGTFYAPESPSDYKEGDYLLTFKTREDAKKWIREFNSETYYLSHGEYEAPDFKIYKLSENNKKEIASKFY